jgi:hypothetical protein
MNQLQQQFSNTETTNAMAANQGQISSSSIFQKSAFMEEFEGTII